MNRNLLYTAVTRARKCVTILGSQEVVDGMIENETSITGIPDLAGGYWSWKVRSVCGKRQNCGAAFSKEMHCV